MWRVLSGTEAGTSALPHYSLAISLLKGLLLYKTAGLMIQRNALSLLHEDVAAQIETLPKKPIPLSVTHTQLLKPWVLLINTVPQGSDAICGSGFHRSGMCGLPLLLSLLNILPKRVSWAWIIRSTWHFHRSPSMAVYGSFIFSLRDTS